MYIHTCVHTACQIETEHTYRKSEKRDVLREIKDPAMGRKTKRDRERERERERKSEQADAVSYLVARTRRCTVHYNFSLLAPVKSLLPSSVYYTRAAPVKKKNCSRLSSSLAQQSPGWIYSRRQKAWTLAARIHTTIR